MRIVNLAFLVLLLCFNASAATPAEEHQKNGSTVVPRQLSEYDVFIGVDMTPQQPYSKELAKLAGKGEARAMIDLGDCYFAGSGVKKDAKKAAELYEKTTKQKTASAQLREEAYRKLARCYFDWDGVEKNREKVLKIYEKAVKDSIMPIAETLLTIYSNGLAEKSPGYNAYRMRQTLVNNGRMQYLPALIRDYMGRDAIKADPLQVASFLRKMSEIPEMKEEMKALVQRGRQLARKEPPTRILESWSHPLMSRFVIYEPIFKLDNVEYGLKDKIAEGLSNFSEDAMLADLCYKIKKNNPAKNLSDEMVLVILFSQPDSFVEFANKRDDKTYLTHFIELWTQYSPTTMIDYVDQAGPNALPCVKDALRAFMYTPEGKEYSERISKSLRSK